MKVFLLMVKQHLPQEDERSLPINQPTWEEIESAIRRLDRNEWPFVWLSARMPINGAVQNKTFLVAGGLGEYRMFCTHNGRHIEYDEPSRGTEPVQTIERHYHSVVQKRSLCNNIYRVLELVRFFAFTGELSPDASWIES